jgi:hypothetical protein
MSRSRIFHLAGDVTITGEGLQNLGLCLALRAFEQGGIFIVSHLLWHEASVFRSHPKDCPILSPFTTHEGMWRIYSYPGPYRSPFSLTKRKGMLRTYSYQDPHGYWTLITDKPFPQHMYEGCSEIIETFSLTSLKYLINQWNFTNLLPRTYETNVLNFNAIT